MAFSVRIEGIDAHGSRAFSIEPHWWKIPELGKNVKFNWIRSNDTGSYLDNDADISIDEARILHEQFKPELEKLIAFNIECLESSKERTDEHASSVIKQ